MEKPIVTIIGHTCIDHNTINGTSYEKWGSSAMYIAKYLSKEFNITSRIVSSYGHDFVKYRDDFIFLEPPSGYTTLLYKNVVTNGNRIQFCHHSNSSPPIRISRHVAEILRKTDILVVAPMLTNYDEKYIKQVMQYTPEQTFKVLLPQGYMRHINDKNEIEKREFSEAKYVLPYFDAVIASDEDCDNALLVAKKWADYKKGLHIVITQAEKGATVFDDSTVVQVPTTPIPFSEIKNPVGSGDMFSAQFAISMYNGLRPSEAVDQANKATAKALLSDPLL